MAQNQTDNQFLAVALGALAAGQRRRKNVGGMRRILFPVDVVVIHAADHQGIGQRSGDGVYALARADNGGRTASRDLVEDLQGNLDVVLLVSAERAADG